MNQDYINLQKLGLTNSEIKVYVTLLELNESQTGKLCSLTSIPSSRIYSILESLISKGLVSYKILNKIKIFMPAPPEILESILKEKHKKILSAVKLLKEKNLKTSNFQYKIFNNLRGVKAMFYEINSIMNKDMLLSYYTSTKGSFERLIGVLNEHHDVRLTNQIKSRLLLSLDNKTLGVKRKNKFTQVRYTKLNTSVEWGLVGDRMLYIFYIQGDEPKGILVEDSVIVKTFNEVFEKVWNNSKSN